MREFIIGIHLSFGDLYEEGGTGDLKQPLDGGIDRLIALIDFCQERLKGQNTSTDFRIISTAGYSKLSPTSKESQNERDLSLAEQALRYVHDKYGMITALKIIAKPLAWGTRHEILSCFNLVEWELGHLIDRYDVIRFVFASHPLHLRRVKRYYNLSMIKASHKVTYIEVNHHFPPYSYLHEYGAWIRDMGWRIFDGEYA